MPFDPSQPFEEVKASTVAFDPSQPFAAEAPDWNTMFSGVDGLDKRVSRDQRRALEALDWTSDEQAHEDKTRAVNQSYVSNAVPGVPLAVMQENWGAVKSAYAKNVLGIDTPDITDSALYSGISEHVKAKQVHLTQEFQAASPYGKIKLLGTLFASHSGENAKDLWDSANKPFHALPSAPQMPDIPSMGPFNPMQVAAIYNSVKPLLEGIETPLTVATLGFSGELQAAAKAYPAARVALAGMAGTFTGLMAKGTTESIKAAPDVFRDPNSTTQQKIEAVGSVVAMGAATLLGSLGTFLELMPPKKVGGFKADLQNRTPDEAAAIIRQEAATSTDSALITAAHEAADQLDTIGEKGTAAAEEAAKPADGTEAKPVFKVQEMDNGGFVITDETGKLVDYASTREEAATIAGEPGATPAAPKPKEKAAEPPVLDSEAHISIKNAAMDKELAEMGMEPATSGEKLTWKKAMEDAAAKVKEDPEAAARLVKELSDNPRAVNGHEDALLITEANRLMNEREAADARLTEAAKTEDPKAIADAQARVDEASDAFYTAADALKKAGTQTAQGLAMRRMIIKRDYSLAAMEQKVRAVSGGKRLTSELAAQVKELSERLDASQRAFDEYRAKGVRSSRARVSVLEKLSGHADAARERIKERLKEGRSASGLDPADLLDHAIVVADYLAKGAKDWSEKLVKEFGEKVRPYLSEIHAKAQAIGKDPDAVITLEKRRVALVKAIEKLEEKIETGDTSVTPGKSSRPEVKDLEVLMQKRDELRGELTAMRDKESRVKELQEAIAKKEEKIAAKDTSAEGSPQNRPAIDEVEQLKQRRDSLNRQMEQLRKEKRADSAEARKIEQEAARLEKSIKEKQEKLATGDLSSPDAKANRPGVEAIETLKQERDALNEQLAEARKEAAKPSDAEVLKTKVDAIEKDILDKRARIKSGDVQPKVDGTANRPEVRELEEAKQRLTEVNRDLAEARKGPPKDPEQVRLDAAKTRLTNRNEVLKDRLEKGDASALTPPRKPLHLDEEANHLQAENEMLKMEFDQLVERTKYNNKTLLGKAAAQAGSAYDGARMLMTTGEFSFLFRQGKATFLSNPITSALALPDTVRAFFADPVGAHAIDLKTLNHPDVAAAKAAKLHLLQEGAKITKQEEFLVGSMMAEKVPVVGPLVKKFEQAATTFLNRVRLDVWREMRKNIEGLTPEQDKTLAHMVNVATGRGTLGALEQAAVPLARLLFSPRFLSSRIQLALGEPLWGGDFATRRVIAGQYAKTLVNLGLYYSLIYTGFKALGVAPTISTDPTSSDFGKIKIGNSRLDPLAGISQVIVFGARMALGEKTNSKGKTVPIRGDKVPFGGDRSFDVAARFARSKLHPVPAAIVNLFDGTDLGGNQADLANQSVNFVAPVTYTDIYQALEEQDLPEGVALSLLAVLGEGLQTYDANAKKKSVKK